MTDHPIKELRDLHKDIRPPNKNTRLAIFFSLVAGAFLILVFLLSGVVFSPTLAPDPIQRGAEHAFDVEPVDPPPAP